MEDTGPRSPGATVPVHGPVAQDPRAPGICVCPGPRFGKRFFRKDPEVGACGLGGRGPWGDPEGGEMVPLACPFLVGPSWWVWRVGSGRL